MEIVEGKSASKVILLLKDNSGLLVVGESAKKEAFYSSLKRINCDSRKFANLKR